MTDLEMIDAQRSLALALLDLCQRRQLEPDDVPALLSGAMLEALAQRVGIPGAIERLRVIADLAEQQLFAEMGKTARPN